jgi:hypothetical protein
MNRSAALVLTLALGVSAAACKTAAPQQDAPPTPSTPSTGDFAGEEKIRFKSEGSGSSTNEPGVGAYIAAPFENVLYLPWKVIGSGIKGASDGVGAGFTKDRMPVYGIIFSPVNLVVGLLTGMGEGAVMKPGVVGPSDSFSHAMAQPPKHVTTIWWY